MPKHLISEVSARTAKLSAALERGRDPTPELKKLRALIDKRKAYLVAQLELADVDEDPFLFESTDFPEFDELFGLLDLPPPPPKRKRKIVFRVKFTTCGESVRAVASVLSDHPFADKIPASCLNDRKREKDVCPSFKDGTAGVWAWLETHYFGLRANVDDLVNLTQLSVDEDYLGSHLLSSVLVDMPLEDLDHTPHSLAGRFVAALIPPSDTLTSRRTDKAPRVCAPDESLDSSLLQVCSEAGFLVSEGPPTDSPLYVEARHVAAKLRQIQSHNANRAAILASRVLAAKRDIRKASDLHFQYNRLRKKQSGESKKRKLDAKKKASLPW